MPVLNPRQVAVRAQETAALLLSALDREGLVTRFLRAYAKEGKRPGRTADAQRYRELTEAIRREALLLLVLRVESGWPQHIGNRPAKRLASDQAKLAGLFREEFFVSLGRGLDWSEDEFQGFCRDLEMYQKLSAAAPPSAGGRGSKALPQGPFVDRCGFLLDPALLDQARRAAARFESELTATAESVLRKVFSRR